MCVPECSVITSIAEAPVRDSRRIALVPAVQVQQHARLVRRPHRRARVARLLEVVDPGAAQRVDQSHSTAWKSRPWVSGSTVRASRAST